MCHAIRPANPGVPSPARRSVVQSVAPCWSCSPGANCRSANQHATQRLPPSALLKSQARYSVDKIMRGRMRPRMQLHVVDDEDYDRAKHNPGCACACLTVQKHPTSSKLAASQVFYCCRRGSLSPERRGRRAQHVSGRFDETRRSLNRARPGCVTPFMCLQRNYP